MNWPNITKKNILLFAGYIIFLSLASFVLETKYSIIIMVILFVIIIILLCYTIKISSENSIMSRYMGVVLSKVLILDIIFIFLLTFLLVKGLIPDYFSSIYILLGSIFVFSIDLYFKNSLNMEKEQKKKIRVALLIEQAIRLNLFDAKLILEKIEGNIFVSLYPLQESFEFSPYILDVDFDEVYVLNILRIKNGVSMTNEVIYHREKLLETVDHPKKDKNIKKSIDMSNKTIIKGCEMLIEVSNKLLDIKHD